MPAYSMTWQEFKTKAEAQGVTDNTIICYDDMNFPGADEAESFDESCWDYDKEADELRVRSLLWEPVD